METTDIKQEAHRLVDKLSHDATWDDLMYESMSGRQLSAELQTAMRSRHTDRRSPCQIRSPAVRVHFTDAALQQLDGIYSYISKDSTKYAQRVVDQLFRRPTASRCFSCSDNCARVFEL